MKHDRHRPVLIVFCLLLISPFARMCSATSDQVGQRISDDQGPTITPEMPNFIDTIGTGECDEYPLVLRAGVNDSAGVSQVIGSYCNRLDGVWHNVTMSVSPEFESRVVYESEPINYTLCNHNTSVVWDIIFYAQNSLGIWSTENTSQSVCRIWISNSRTTTSADLSGVTILLIFSVAAATIVIVAYAKRVGSSASGQTSR